MPYPELVPTVYMTSRDPRVKFHRAPDCSMIVKSLRGAQPIEVDLDELERPVACLRCYPDSPRAVSYHRYCELCNGGSARPCAHNGGVPVQMTRTRRKDSLAADAGESYVRVDYVWPEHARHYNAS